MDRKLGRDRGYLHVRPAVPVIDSIRTPFKNCHIVHPFIFSPSAGRWIELIADPFSADNDAYHYACAAKQVVRLGVLVVDKNVCLLLQPRAPTG